MFFKELSSVFCPVQSSPRPLRSACATCFKRVDFLSPLPNRRNENTLKYRSFSLICYGYCYYGGESPISGHSMARDCLKHYFEPCRSNESDFALG